MSIAKNLVKTICYIIFCCISITLSGCATTNNHLMQQPRVQQFVNKMVVRHGFSRYTLERQFAQVTIHPAVTRSIQAPREKTSPWLVYQRLFVTPETIRNGARFWKENAEALNYAEQHYGVPPHIIVAILGVETRYGKAQGKFKVFDALATLAFGRTHRATYFESELEHFLLLARELHVDPDTLRGSYAGAIGQPQFMPSSYRRFAIDTTGKGYSDLMHNNRDAIISVANYFQHFGWQSQQPVAVTARTLNDRFRHLPQMAYAPKFTQATLRRAYGLVPIAPLSRDTRATVVRLEGKDGLEIWLGLKNFYVITRYNNSALYAMAVNELSQRVQKLHGAS